MSDVSPTDAGRLRAGTRALLAAVGVVAVVVGLGVATLAVALWAGSGAGGAHPARRPGHEAGVAIAAIALFGGFAAMGATWVVAAVRGHASRGIFDRAERWMRRRWYVSSVVGWAALLAAAYAISAPEEVPVATTWSVVRVAWLVLVGLLVLPVQTAWHELGHAAAGALAGLRFRSLRVGALAVTRQAGRLRASWQPLENAFGLHAAAPETAAGLGARLAVHAAGGPIASLAAAAACFAGSDAVARATALGAAGSDVLRIGGWVGLLLGTVNLVPFRTRSGRPSDGAALLAGLRRGGTAERAALFFRAMWVAGRRPRSWGVDPAYFVDAAAQPGAERDALLLAGACVALDGGARARAAEILRSALALPTAAPAFRRELELQAAMVHALGGDAATARERLPSSDGASEAPWYPMLAEAAVRLAEGRLADASEALARWERGVSDCGTAASTRVGNEWAVDELRRRLAR